jgi:hypothetical protein
LLALLIEGFDHPAPRLALTVVDLAQVQHLALHYFSTSAPLTLHDVPIAMLLAIFDPSVAPQIHDGHALYAKIPA